jgi:putative ABC transport system substrate-binding protein
MARVGFTGLSSPAAANPVVAPFWNRLRELGYVEGQNLATEIRWAEGDYALLPGLMAELVSRKVDVIVTTATRAAVAAKSATTTIPIVAVGVGVNRPPRRRAS